MDPNAVVEELRKVIAKMNRAAMCKSQEARNSINDSAKQDLEYFVSLISNEA